jgi:hypothetical protein
MRPNMGNVYHCWCFDEACRAFRVTHYSNYYPAARTAAGYPLCVELWSDDPDAAQAIDRENALATRQLADALRP